MTRHNLIDLIRQFDGRVDGSSVLVPAERLGEYIDAAVRSGVAVPYIECLFFCASGVRPSMVLSGAAEQFGSFEDFSNFANQSARLAFDEARASNSTAYFEVDTIR